MKRSYIIGLALAAAVGAGPANAQELTGTLKNIKETGAITLGHRDSSIPFSYLDDNQKPIGYAMDICMKIVDAVKKELKLDKLEVKLNPVTSATRIPLMANGTIDLECGSTTNNAERQKQVWFTNTHFLTASRYVSKKSSKIEKIDDLKGKAVVSTAGTTNTGAVDPIAAIADLCAREGLWHHVDGAYGAFFHMVPGLRPLLAGLPRADSLTLDPHKGLFLPYGTGALLVRDGEALRALHGSEAGYLPANQNEFYDPAQYGPELSRGFPGLRVWLTMKLLGTDRYRAALSEKRGLALWAADEIAKIPGIVMDAAPQLSLFAFHLEHPNLPTLEAQNAATRALMQRVTARGRVMVTGAQVGDRFLGRVCVLSFRTRRAQIDACVEDIASETAVLVAGDQAI